MSTRARLGVTLLLLLGSCTTHQDDLRRAQQAFTDARYEDVEVWLFALEPEVGRMTLEQRATYYYLAGMSAFRIGHRARARHALLLCREESLQLSDFPAQWLHNMHTAIDELEAR